MLRAGRTTVVIEVALVDERERDIGIATMSFAVLPRRDTNPEVTLIRDEPVDDGDGRSRASRGRCSTSSASRCATRRAASIDVPVVDWSLNSMGAMQGGVVATVAEVAAETALRAATGEPLVVSDLHAHLPRLRPGRPGALARSRCSARPPATARRASSSSTPGAENRRMTVAHAVATRGLA